MPRLPTMRVIGSHAMSTSSPACPPVSCRCVAVMSCVPSPGTCRAAGQLPAGPAPLRLAVERVGGDAAQAADRRAVDPDGAGRQPAARWLVHERHELVREAGHGAADADATDVRAAADAVDPAALGDVALHHRAPAAQLDDAL